MGRYVRYFAGISKRGAVKYKDVIGSIGVLGAPAIRNLRECRTGFRFERRFSLFFFRLSDGKPKSLEVEPTAFSHLDSPGSPFWARYFAPRSKSVGFGPG